MKDAHSRKTDATTPTLTEAELSVLAVVEDISHELGYAPTFREMLERLGWSPKSKGALHQYLEQLRGGTVSSPGAGARSAS